MQAQQGATCGVACTGCSMQRLSRQPVAIAGVHAQVGLDLGLQVRILCSSRQCVGIQESRFHRSRAECCAAVRLPDRRKAKHASRTMPLEHSRSEGASVRNCVDQQGARFVLPPSMCHSARSCHSARLWLHSTRPPALRITWKSPAGMRGAGPVCIQGYGASKAIASRCAGHGTSPAQLISCLPAPDLRFYLETGSLTVMLDRCLMRGW